MVQTSERNVNFGQTAAKIAYYYLFEHKVPTGISCEDTESLGEIYQWKAESHHVYEKPNGST